MQPNFCSHCASAGSHGLLSRQSLLQYCGVWGQSQSLAAHLVVLVGVKGSLDEAGGADVIVWVGDHGGLALKGQARLAHCQHVHCTQQHTMTLYGLPIAQMTG